MSDGPDTIGILRETLELERAATARYAEHQTWAGDPRLCAYWEGLRRNESDHRAAMIAELDLADAAARDEPAAAQAAQPADVAGPDAGSVAPAGEHPTPTATDVPGPHATLRERGYVRILATLRSDLEFERQAIEKYATFAKQLADPRLKALMRDFVRAETGHARGLKSMIERVGAADYPVVVYCPTCGWELDIGRDPAEGAAIHCPMCAMDFALRAIDGDFVLTRV